MSNFFDSHDYQLNTNHDPIKQVVFLKIHSSKFIRCHLELQNTIITLTDQNNQCSTLSTLNIANAYIEFTVHVCMGRGVIVHQLEGKIEMYGLTSQLIQILKLYGIQKDFASQYKTIKQIGQGSFGKVYHVKKISNNSQFAVKVFDKQLLLDPRDKSAILKEIQILRLMNHPNVLTIIECFESDQCLFLVEELFVSQLVIDAKNTLKEDKAAVKLIKLLNGLEYIHAKHIIHRDLKPNNILLRSTGEPVIADFGLADFYSQDGHYLFQRCGTRGYVAPEMLQNMAYDYKVDIYSLGVVFHQLLTGQIPRPWDNYNLSHDCLTLLIGMLHSDPAKRYQISEIRSSKLMKKTQKRMVFLNAMGSMSDLIKKEEPINSINNSEIVTKPLSLNSPHPQSLKNI